MDCEDFREALSARLDNEEATDHPTDAHLEYCTDCRYWYDAAALITRRTRTSAVVAWPDVSDAVLARVPPGADRRWSRARLGLGAVGVLQCGTGLVTLATQAGTGFETGAWQFGLGVTLGAVAVRRLPAGALLPLLGTLVAVLAWGQIAGGLTPTGVASLVQAAVALALVVVLCRVSPSERFPGTPKPAANRLRRPEPPADNDDTANLAIPVTRSAKTA